MSTLCDPATPYHQAQTAQELQPGSVLVTVEGAGHTTLFTSTCADAIVEAFLLDDVLPDNGTTCAQDRSLPFAPIDQGAADGRNVLLRRVGRPG